ncbi:hypothetical protein ARALYDRAFT_473338, partial [Arabidopsis lyrata subsp. lyrata]
LDVWKEHIDVENVGMQANKAKILNLSVTWAYELTTSDPKEKVMFGFIAAAGTNTEEYRLLSWELSSTLDIEKADSKIGLVVGISVSGFVLLIVLVHTIVVVWSRKQRKKKDRDIANMISINEDLEREAGPRKFSSHRELGEGGFGAVYEGNLKEINTMVAVKKLSSDSRQRKKEFLNEVKVISKLRHRNMVQLIGWCNEKNEFLLIYELVLNGSLNSHLFGKRPHLLSWDIRYKIALGLASALLYLHEEWDQCVLHKDIKASNIMLDSDFNVKLGDFGLARVMNHEHGSHTTGLVGTFGYMAHEYVTKGSASKESDIYSFGIVLIEIVTGRKSLERTQEDNSDSESNEKSLVEKVWKLYGKQEGNEFDNKEAECLLVLGSRPSIKQAIQVLNFELPFPDLPLKRDVAMYYISITTTSSSSP